MYGGLYAMVSPWLSRIPLLEVNPSKNEIHLLFALLNIVTCEVQPNMTAMTSYENTP